jgi:hypothetical protein
MDRMRNPLLPWRHILSPTSAEAIALMFLSLAFRVLQSRRSRTRHSQAGSRRPIHRNGAGRPYLSWCDRALRHGAALAGHADSPFKQSYKWASEYRYADTTILGFVHTQLSGCGHSDLGDVLLQPISGEVRLEPGDADKPVAASLKAMPGNTPGTSRRMCKGSSLCSEANSN